MRWLTILHHALRFIDSVQVELQGRYSVARLHELSAHIKDAGLLSTLLVIAFTPVPCLLVTILLDVPTMPPPEVGVYRMTAWFWCRVTFTISLITYCTLVQFCQCSPELTIASKLKLSISIVFGLASCLCIFTFGVVIGFPTPFVPQLVTTLLTPPLVMTVYLSWKRVLDNNAEARVHLQSFLQSWGGQIAMTVVYPIYYFAYTQFQGDSKAAFAIVGSILKLLLKNWAIKGLTYMEDLAPTFITFSIDVFHAVFASRTTQRMQSGGTLLVLMTIDTIQNFVAYYEVHTVLQRIRADACDLNALTHNRKANQLHLATSGPIALASHLLESSEELRNRPELMQGRLVKQDQASRSLFSTQRIAPAENASSQMKSATGVSKLFITVSPPFAVSTPSIHCDTAQLRTVTGVLSLLHMTESYVLIEFVEAIVPGIYAIYLFAMTKIPSRKFYTQINTLTDDQLHDAARDVAMHAMLELLSFIVFCWLIDCKLRPFSTLRQLAFVLRKHWKMAHAMLLLWVLFVGQQSLVHSGNDYTFQFPWLHQPPQSSPPTR